MGKIFKKDIYFVCKGKEAVRLGTWFLENGVKVIDQDEVSSNVWRFKVRMNFIERLMYRLEFAGKERWLIGG